MRVIELFAGIAGFGVGFERAGHKVVAHVEQDKQCLSILKRHYPAVPQFNDVRTVGAHNLPEADIICGGFPCQDLSVAGARAGISGARSGLFYEIIRLTQELRPAYVCWENVPGLLSSDKGRDFMRILMAFHRIGYFGCVRMYDAQYFGLAQRRRRLFGVFARPDIGVERCVQILALTSGMSGHPRPRAQTAKDLATTLEGRAGTSGENNFNTSGGLVAGTLGSNGSGGSRTTDLDQHGALIVGALHAGDRGATVDSAAANQFVVAPITGYPKGDNASRESQLVAGTLNSHSSRHDPTQETLIAKTCNAGRDGYNDGSDQTYIVEKPVAYRTTGNCGVQTTGDKVGALNQGTDQCQQIIQTLQTSGVSLHSSDASTQKTNPNPVLQLLRNQIGEEAFTEWGLGILVPFYTKEVLQSAVHGASVRPETFRNGWTQCCPSSSQADRSQWALQSLLQTKCKGRSSQGRELPEQLIIELGAYLSLLSQPRAQKEGVLFDLWKASEGIGVLRKALSEIQEIWRSASLQTQPALASHTVRRLTVTECEFLQGFPRSWTALYHDDKPVSDSARYRMLGNAVPPPVIFSIARRIIS